MNTVLYSSVKNKQDHKKILCVFLSLLVLLSCINFSYADNDFTQAAIYDNTSAPSYEWLSQNGYAVTESNATKYYGVFNTTDEHVYYTWALIDNVWKLYYFSLNPAKGAFGWNNQYVNSSNNFVQSDTVYYREYAYYSEPLLINVSFTSFEDAKQAFIEFANNDFTDNSGITNNGNAIVVVNPGNVAYIGYNSATFNFLITLDKPVSKYYSNARYGFATELPEGTLTFSPSTGNALPLTKSVPDLLGRSATWIGHVNTDTIGYFIVYNPVYDQNGDTNKPIRVTVTLGYMNVTQFPLTATDIGGDIVSTGSSDIFYISDGMQGVTDLPNYIYSVTENGETTTSSALNVPVTPYNYTSPQNESAESGLQGFIQQIIDLLSAPIKHVQNLYNSAIGFFGYLTSLWSWLPAEISTIIVSALAVLVVIGVVKFLWK